jgi:predicted regulator of Ras-like GTPase activity (Roadblock/LC7/MglB family)
MSFASILRGIVEQCGGGLGAALMGSDGIPIEQVVAPRAAGALAEDDVGTAGVEFGRILGEIRKASDALSGGAVAETVVVLARFTLLFRSLDEDTFLILVLAPDGNLGKARYLIRRQLGALLQEL